MKLKEAKTRGGESGLRFVDPSEGTLTRFLLSFPHTISVRHDHAVVELGGHSTLRSLRYLAATG